MKPMNISTGAICAIILARGVYAQGVTPVSGFHADPFAKEGRLEVVSSTIPVAGVPAAKATVTVGCYEASQLKQLAVAFLGMKEGPHLHFNVAIAGPSLDVSTSGRTLDYRLRFDQDEQITTVTDATDLHHADFDYGDPIQVNHRNRLLIGLSASGYPVALQLNLGEPALKNILGQCAAVAEKFQAEQREKRDARDAETAKETANQPEVVKAAAQRFGHPLGFPCTAIANRDLVIARVLGSGEVENDPAVKVKAGTKLYVIRDHPGAPGYTEVLALRPKNDSRGTINGQVNRTSITIQCDAKAVADDEQVGDAIMKSILAREEKRFLAMAGYLGLGPVPDAAATHGITKITEEAGMRPYSPRHGIRVKTTADARVYKVGGSGPRKFGDPTHGIDPEIANTMAETEFVDGGLIPRGTTGGILASGGSAKIIAGEKFVEILTDRSAFLFVPVSAIAFDTDWKAKHNIRE